MLSRCRRDGRAKYGVAVRMLVFKLAMRDEAREWVFVVRRAHHEQVIRVHALEILVADPKYQIAQRHPVTQIFFRHG